MTIALNFTVPLKQDPQSQESLKHMADSFEESVQPMIDDALSRSQIVHFARILVIDNKYLQVITEFDGDPTDYTEFFRCELGPVFQEIFALAEGAPPWEELDNRDAFYKYTHSLNIVSLGASTDCNEGRGYLFSAVGDKSVRELQKALVSNGFGPA